MKKPDRESLTKKAQGLKGKAKKARTDGKRAVAKAFKKGARKLARAAKKLPKPIAAIAEKVGAAAS